MLQSKTDFDKLFEILNEHYPSWEYVDLTKKGYIIQRWNNIGTLIEKIRELYDETL